MSDKGEASHRLKINTTSSGKRINVLKRHEDIAERWYHVRDHLQDVFPGEAENYHVLSTLLDLYWLHYELDGFSNKPLVADGGVAAIDGKPANQDGDFQASVDLLVDRHGYDGAERRLLAALGQVRKRRFEDVEDR